MSKSTWLTENEKTQISLLHSMKKSIKFISEKIGRSRNVVTKYIKDPINYGKKKSTGRKKKLSIRTISAVIKEAKGKNITAKKIIQKFDLRVHKSTITRILNKDGKLKRRKIKRKPILQKIHKRNRLLFAGQYRNLKEKWNSVIFSDEKKFNLDGPDGYNYYWGGLNIKEPIYSRRSMGGESIMVWGCFNYSKKSKLAIIKGNIDSIKYQNVLKDHLLPFIIDQNRNQIIFQQDNAKPHVSNSTKLWFESHNIKLMSWPAFSPDLNPIENLWAILSRAVYSEGQVYNNINELELSIIKNWNEISTRTLKKLVDSMEKRVEDVIKNDGGSTKY